MALGTPVAAAAAYSASAGTTVAPAYPTGILASDVVLLFVGQKPTTTTGGTVTTPSGWTLRDELTGAGGYAAQGADTGNTNLRVYSWDNPVAGQTGTLSVTLGGNDVTWAFMVRIPSGGGALSYGSADGQRTTTPTSPMAIALTNGATATNFQTGDRAIWAMCIPTDVTTPSQFSAQSITATGATFGTATELNEPDSTTGNDIGGYSAWAAVTAGSSTTAPTVTATLAGTLTNVRGPVVLLRVREAAVTHATTGVLTGQIGSIAGAAQVNSPHATTGALTGPGSTIVGSADRQSGTVSHNTTGALTGPGSTVAGAAARTRAHPTSGALPGQTATVAGAAARSAGPVTHATTGALTGQGSTATGSAARFRAFATTGTLTGQGATTAGDATRTRAHPATGVLAGQQAVVTGDASRAGAAVLHDTTGDLVGIASEVVGEASRESPAPVAPVERGDGVDARWTPKQRRERDRRLAEERERKDDLRQLIKRALDPVAEASEVEVVTVDDGVVVIPAAGQPVAVPRPEGIDLRGLSREVGKILSDAKVQAERTRRAEAREVARQALKQARENLRRLIRKRQQEEFLLLMT